MENASQKQLIEALREDMEKRYELVYEVIGGKLGEMHSGFAKQLEPVQEMN